MIFGHDFLPAEIRPYAALVAVLTLLICVGFAVAFAVVREPRPDMTLEAVGLAVIGSLEWHGPDRQTTDGAIIDLLELLTQQALEGNISVWGRQYSPPVLTQQLEPIPKDHWRAHEISAVAFLDDHLGESWTRYSALAPEPALKDLNFDKCEIRAIRRQWKKNHGR